MAMDIAEKPEKVDIVVEKNGLKLYIHKDAAPQLEKASMDCDKAGGITVKGLPKAAR